MKIDRSKARGKKSTARTKWDKENMRDPIGDMVRAIDRSELAAVTNVHRLRNRSKVKKETSMGVHGGS